ncbi:hypothetical protein Vretimale_2980 [Volvox reticuliferus]|uniref:Nudix hydrolase domain-containing protein n=1 Tax=Volvox reticuliferus TaxID=1737510 RepID=A0A8J4CB00_9CHLO|nr:hypothetical protein Vretifemale_6911 [Volvox reticuliferus]GIL97253.1 hypothetical protein Vretimale_2980 [Volvox reticuliferus]
MSMGNKHEKDKIGAPTRTLILCGVNEGLHQLACKHCCNFKFYHFANVSENEIVIKAAVPRALDGSIDRSHVVTVILSTEQSRTCPGAEPTIGSTNASPPDPLENILGLARDVRSVCPHAFIVLWHPAATEDAAMRLSAFNAGANMVSCYLEHLEEVLQKLGSIGSGPMAGSCSCLWCGQCGMTAEELWLHQPLYHIYDANRSGRCTACGEEADNLAVHIHEEHYPGGPRREDRRGLGAAVVVHRRRDNKFLMVQEFAGQGFWVPGGATDVGESVRRSAERECFEEAGVKIKLQGLAEVSGTASKSLAAIDCISTYEA